MGEYDQGVLQADAAKEANVQLFLFSTLPYVGPDFMGLGGVELYDGWCGHHIVMPGFYTHFIHGHQRRRAPTTILHQSGFLLFIWAHLRSLIMCILGPWSSEAMTASGLIVSLVYIVT